MKIRKIIKAHTAAVILLSAAFLSAGCAADTSAAQKEPDALAEAPSENDPANETDTAGDSGKTAENVHIYDHILAQYQDMVQNDFYADLQNSDTYESCFGEDIALEIRTHQQDIYYALYDIDGNGTAELLIAGGENSASSPTCSFWNYALYGYDGTNAVPLFPDMEFGYRTNVSLYENGVIEVFYSSSAAESGVDFYQIGSDGFTPERIDSFSAVGHLEGDTPIWTYLQNGTELTEEEYNAGIQRYETALTNPDWIPIQ